MSDIPPQVDRAVAENAVKGPAIGLIVCGALGALGSILGLVGGGGLPADAEQIPENVRNLIQGAGMAGNLLFLAINGLILFGGLKMKGLQARGLAMTACILAIVNLSCCCLSAIFGIWGLIALGKPEVKAAFQP